VTRCDTKKNEIKRREGFIFPPLKRASLPFRFYVGCDVCNDWFHGSCVGISEEMSRSMSEFVCVACRSAKDNQEIYCLCKQPYDETQ
jgi:hypothetical protein